MLIAVNLYYNAPRQRHEVDDELSDRRLTTKMGRGEVSFAKSPPEVKLLNGHTSTHAACKPASVVAERLVRHTYPHPKLPHCIRQF